MLIVERDELRKDAAMTKWLSCVALLSQTFHKMRTSDDRPLQMLIKPLLQVLELCLSASAGDDELTCAATQVCTLLVVCLNTGDQLRSEKLLKLVATDLL